MAMGSLCASCVVLLSEAPYRYGRPGRSKAAVARSGQRLRLVGVHLAERWVAQLSNEGLTKSIISSTMPLNVLPSNTPPLFDTPW